MPTTLYYSAHDDETAHRYQVTLYRNYDLDSGLWDDSIAEQCAKNWHSQHDGWEALWPRVFALYRDKTGPAFARIRVEREMVPEFVARKA